MSTAWSVTTGVVSERQVQSGLRPSTALEKLCSYLDKKTDPLYVHLSFVCVPQVSVRVWCSACANTCCAPNSACTSCTGHYRDR